MRATLYNFNKTYVIVWTCLWTGCLLPWYGQRHKLMNTFRFSIHDLVACLFCNFCKLFSKNLAGFVYNDINFHLNSANYRFIWVIRTLFVDRFILLTVLKVSDTNIKFRYIVHSWEIYEIKIVCIIAIFQKNTLCQKQVHLSYIIFQNIKLNINCCC